ncbi:hypothetical protein, partial [Levilactobacillus spicheri]
SNTQQHGQNHSSYPLPSVSDVIQSVKKAVHLVFNNSHKVRVKAARHWFQGRLFHQAQTITSRDAKKTYIVTRQITLATNDHKDTFVEVTPERWTFAPIKHWIHIDNVTPIK